MRKLTKKEIAKMMASRIFIPDSEMSKEAGAPGRRDEEGNVLFKETNGSGIFWERAELQELLASKRPRPHHILEGLIHSGMEFERNIPQQIETMAKALNLCLDFFDFSVESIKMIDERLNNPTIWAQRFQFFEGILGYVGEVVRRVRNCKWDLRTGFDGRTVEPWIVTSRGKSLQFYYLIFNVLLLHEKTGPLSLYWALRHFLGPIPEKE